MVHTPGHGCRPDEPPCALVPLPLRVGPVIRPGQVAAIVLAAGTSSRFGAVKALASLDGRPLLQHVLDTVHGLGLGRVVVVLGRVAPEIEAAIAWHGEEIVHNPEPEAGLASSLRIGFAALAGAAVSAEQATGIEAALVLLGDQPLVRADVMRRLIQAVEPAGRPIVAPRYSGDGGRNPVLLHRSAWPLVQRTGGDAGLGPLLSQHPDLVQELDVAGSNIDVDTPADLAALAWEARVRGNREQVDRFREVPDGADFYGPEAGRFRDDPHRTGDDVLEKLRSMARPDETWLDIGAGAGRYAVPLALLVREVIAVDPSPGMLAALGETCAEHGVTNVRVIQGRWPLGPAAAPEAVRADVALIANVGYDIEAIAPFLDAMEATARQACVAVLMDRQPASMAEPFWPLIHGERRVALPALPEFVELLRARGREVDVDTVERPPRPFPDEAALAAFIRRQLWIAPGGDKDRLLGALLRDQIRPSGGGVMLASRQPSRIGIARWSPAPATRVAPSA